MIEEKAMMHVGDMDEDDGGDHDHEDRSHHTSHLDTRVMAPPIKHPMMHGKPEGEKVKGPEDKSMEEEEEAASDKSMSADENESKSKKPKKAKKKSV